VGIERYPASSPLAGKPYEYWALWPAPVHNGAFNRIYYDPTVDYLPPVNPDGSSLPTMDAPFTTNWTKVPADRWSANGQNVDLTASVTVGQWCNADWTQGINPATGKTFVSDPAFCRTNGLVAAAAGGAPKADPRFRVLYPDTDKNFEVRYMIERTCIAPGVATVGNCDMMPPKQSSGTTTGDDAPPTLPQIPFYRLTVRVDGPKNTTAFLQAMVR
jgi:hypothetical protein